MNSGQKQTVALAKLIIETADKHEMPNGNVIAACGMAMARHILRYKKDMREFYLKAIIKALKENVEILEKDEKNNGYTPLTTQKE